MQSVLTLGNFDGPHRGHLAIVECGRALADRHGTTLIAITFDPPPVQVLRPGTEPPRIASLADRVATLKAAGVDEVVVVEPTPDLLAQTAERYIASLVDRYDPVAVVEGPDFRFGRGRGGDMGTLAELGRRHGFDAVEVPRVEVPLHDGHVVPVSSSLVRWLVGRGRVADAALCLGRPFSLTATVVHGEQRGRTLGIPTANLDPDALAGFILPADGVYACVAEVEGEQRGTGAEGQRGKVTDPQNQKSSLKNQKSHPAAVSIGTKPTFGTARLTVEAHLIGFTGDLYGQTLTLRFARWVRGQYAFRGVDALRARLHRDIAEVRGTPTRDATPPPVTNP